MTLFQFLGGAILGSALLFQSAEALRAQSLGLQIFEGEVPLNARLRQSTMTLPNRAATCSNCHAVGCSVGRDDQTAPPALGPNHLLTPLKRGSGPPVAYDEAGFCRVLETGRTPSHTVVLRTMPIFEFDGSSCKALWDYLTGDSHACD